MVGNIGAAECSVFGMLLKRGVGNGEWEIEKWENKKKSKNWKKTRNSYTLQINKNMKAEYNVFEAKIIQSVFSKRNYYLIN